MHGIDEYDEIGVVQIRSDIQTRRSEVANFNFGIALVYGTEHFDDERAKTIVAQKNVSDSHNTYSRRAACAHKTFTCANSWPLASIVWQEQAMQGSKE